MSQSGGEDGRRRRFCRRRPAHTVLVGHLQLLVNIHLWRRVNRKQWSEARLDASFTGARFTRIRSAIPRFAGDQLRMRVHKWQQQDLNESLA